MWVVAEFRNREEGGCGMMQSSEIVGRRMWADAELRIERKAAVG